MIRAWPCGSGTWAGARGRGTADVPVVAAVSRRFCRLTGNNLAATAVIAGELVWHILHPPSDRDGWLLAA